MGNNRNFPPGTRPWKGTIQIYFKQEGDTHYTYEQLPGSRRQLT